MHQDNLFVDERPQYLCCELQVRANEIDHNDADVWALDIEVPPVPSPAAPDIRHHAMFGDTVEKPADLPVHDRNGMMAADFEKHVGVVACGLRPRANQLHRQASGIKPSGSASASVSASLEK